MMECISAVQYKVLLNGQPKRHNPTERSTAGGPIISLFIMCTEILVANIKNTETEKQLTGIKVARAYPPIFHSFFADNSLFFCKAQREECQTILRITK